MFAPIAQSGLPLRVSSSGFVPKCTTTRPASTSKRTPGISGPTPRRWRGLGTVKPSCARSALVIAGWRLMRCAICRNSGSAALREVFLASLAARKAASAVWKLPSLVWKSLRALVSGVRSAATSPKVAKFAFSTVMKLYQSQGQSLQLPPSFRFPPLREGNRVGRVGSVPPACRGNLKEGVSISLVFVNCVPAIDITTSDPQAPLPARGCPARTGGRASVARSG